MPKCEHGLTSKECYVCASPKYAAQAEKQEPVAWEAVYETIIHWDEGGGKRSRRELARRIVALYTAPPASLVQEPVGEVLNERGEVDYISYVPPIGTPLYTAPRRWVGLTDGEKEEATGWSVEHIEAKLKDRNAY